jgi:hypothetical protein
MKAQEAVKGLTLEELEGQRAELLPDRIEMHRRVRKIRKRRRSGNVECGGPAACNRITIR